VGGIENTGLIQTKQDEKKRLTPDGRQHARGSLGRRSNDTRCKCKERRRNSTGREKQERKKGLVSKAHAAISLGK